MFGWLRRWWRKPEVPQSAVAVAAAKPARSPADRGDEFEEETHPPDTSRRLQALRKADLLDGLEPEQKAQILSDLTKNDG